MLNSKLCYTVLKGGSFCVCVWLRTGYVSGSSYAEYLINSGASGYVGSGGYVFYSYSVRPALHSPAVEKRDIIEFPTMKVFSDSNSS